MYIVYRDDLTGAKPAVSLVASKTAADVETFSVGAQGVVVALVKYDILAFINVWIQKLYDDEDDDDDIYISIYLII